MKPLPPVTTTGRSATRRVAGAASASTRSIAGTPPAPSSRASSFGRFVASTAPRW